MVCTGNGACPGNGNGTGTGKLDAISLPSTLLKQTGGRRKMISFQDRVIPPPIHVIDTVDDHSMSSVSTNSTMYYSVERKKLLIQPPILRKDLLQKYTQPKIVRGASSLRRPPSPEVRRTPISPEARRMPIHRRAVEHHRKIQQKGALKREIPPVKPTVEQKAALKREIPPVMPTVVWEKETPSAARTAPSVHNVAKKLSTAIMHETRRESPRSVPNPRLSPKGSTIGAESLKSVREAVAETLRSIDSPDDRKIDEFLSSSALSLSSREDEIKDAGSTKINSTGSQMSSAVLQGLGTVEANKKEWSPSHDDGASLLSRENDIKSAASKKSGHPSPSATTPSAASSQPTQPTEFVAFDDAYTTMTSNSSMSVTTAPSGVIATAPRTFHKPDSIGIERVKAVLGRSHHPMMVHGTAPRKNADRRIPVVVANPSLATTDNRQDDGEETISAMGTIGIPVTKPDYSTADSENKQDANDEDLVSAMSAMGIPVTSARSVSSVSLRHIEVASIGHERMKSSDAPIKIEPDSVGGKPLPLDRNPPEDLFVDVTSARSVPAVSRRQSEVVSLGQQEHTKSSTSDTSIKLATHSVGGQPFAQDRNPPEDLPSERDALFEDRLGPFSFKSDITTLSESTENILSDHYTARRALFCGLERKKEITPAAHSTHSKQPRPKASN